MRTAVYQMMNTVASQRMKTAVYQMTPATIQAATIQMMMTAVRLLKQLITAVVTGKLLKFDIQLYIFISCIFSHISQIRMY